MSKAFTRMLGPYRVPVDYGASHREQVLAAQFDWFPCHDGKPTLDEPTEHLHATPGGIHEQSLVLIMPNRRIVTDDVLHEMQQEGVRPALSMEGLAFKRNQLVIPLPLVSLGSVWQTAPQRQEVLYQSVDSDGHYVDLRWRDGEWCACCCFAAVPLNGSNP